MVEPDAESTQRHRALVRVARSRALQLRLDRATRQTAWLIRRSRYLMKRDEGIGELAAFCAYALETSAARPDAG